MKKSDIKILCVDDEPDILEILKYNLSNEGYDISVANDGLSCIKKAKEINPNLIIMDVMMPNICLLYTSPSPRDVEESRMPSSA